jgi:hypothetical protein
MKQNVISEATVLEELKKAIAQTLKLDKDTIQADHSLVKDLGAESLDFLDVDYRLEQSRWPAILSSSTLKRCLARGLRSTKTAS